MMKKFTFVALFIMWTIYAGILAAGYVTHEKYGEDEDSIPAVVTDTKANTAKLQGVTLTTAEVAKHSSVSDCWFIVSGNVYNITPYFNGHPGGNSTMSPYCGKDATKPFQTKDRTFASDHSGSAYSLLNSYLLGKVGETLGSVPTTTKAAPAPKVTTPTVVPTTKSSTTLTYEEVAKHNTRSSCWLVISNNVYNVTNYLTRHPGGVGTILTYCGKKDASGAFAGLPHSVSAATLLRSYLIGSIGQSVSNTAPSKTPATTPATGGDEEDEEDEENDSEVEDDD